IWVFPTRPLAASLLKKLTLGEQLWLPTDLDTALKTVSTKGE
ncbi:unnamed protein product, partial [marine sediment metagenome]